MWHYRTDIDDSSGSEYLQTVAEHLLEEYMERPLSEIMQMVRQTMVKVLPLKTKNLII